MIKSSLLPILLVAVILSSACVHTEAPKASTEPVEKVAEVPNS